ncbi:MAG: sensor domain-containing protein [Actinomycetia bacterium]|nr:sensor domain-containing protein [Actinomycetes bacterium]
MPAGADIGGYRIARVIGSGAMGTVYAVHDPQLPRLDALKVLSEHLSADPDFRKRFQTESDIAAVLDHPHIVSIYDRGETPTGQLWIAMQYVEGTDAEAALRAGTMTPVRAVHIITAIAEALDYAHRRGVLHRDIKPANFLLAGTPGPQELVLLTDFGIARNVDETASTPAGSVMASFAYAAPETVTGGPITSSSDVYSLGCSLFELLTGTLPYADTNGPTAQALAHVRRPPPTPSQRAPGLGPAFDDVIATALHKHPDQRYRTGAELAAAAAAALHTTVTHNDDAKHSAGNTATPATADHPNSALRQPFAPQSWNRPPTTAAKPHRRRAIAAGATVSILVAAAVTATVITSRVDDTSSSTDPSETAAPTTATGAPATIAEADLAGLLPPVADAGAIMAAPLSMVGQPITHLSHDTVDDRTCAALVFPIQDDVYRNSGATASYAQILQDEDTTTGVIAAVTAFPSAELANTFVKRQSQMWPSCERTTVETANAKGQFDTNWTIGTTDTTDTGTLTAQLTRTATGIPPLTCQRALAARNNIVIDIRACQPNITNQAVTLAEQIAADVPG